jgi:hypothetical protein
MFSLSIFKVACCYKKKNLNYALSRMPQKSWPLFKWWASFPKYVWEELDASVATMHAETSWTV